MKNLLKNFVTIISVFLLAVIQFGSPASAKDLVIMTSLPSLEFPFFVHMQKQLDQEARRIGGIKIMAADGKPRAETNSRCGISHHPGCGRYHHQPD